MLWWYSLLWTLHSHAFQIPVKISHKTQSRNARHCTWNTYTSLRLKELCSLSASFSGFLSVNFNNKRPITKHGDAVNFMYVQNSKEIKDREPCYKEDQNQSIFYNKLVFSLCSHQFLIVWSKTILTYHQLLGDTVIHWVARWSTLHKRVLFELIAEDWSFFITLTVRATGATGRFWKQTKKWEWKWK